MSQEITVSPAKKGPLIDLDMESQALGKKIHVDNNAPPRRRKGRVGQKLLGASVLYCYVAALGQGAF